VVFVLFVVGLTTATLGDLAELKYRPPPAFDEKYEEYVLRDAGRLMSRLKADMVGGASDDGLAARTEVENGLVTCSHSKSNSGGRKNKHEHTPEFRPWSAHE
jgi:hypothetical protein